MFVLGRHLEYSDEKNLLGQTCGYYRSYTLGTVNLITHPLLELHLGMSNITLLAYSCPFYQQSQITCHFYGVFGYAMQQFRKLLFLPFNLSIKIKFSIFLHTLKRVTSSKVAQTGSFYFLSVPSGTVISS